MAKSNRGCKILYVLLTSYGNVRWCKWENRLHLDAMTVFGSTKLVIPDMIGSDLDCCKEVIRARQLVFCRIPSKQPTTSGNGKQGWPDYSIIIHVHYEPGITLGTIDLTDIRSIVSRPTSHWRYHQFITERHCHYLQVLYNLWPHGELRKCPPCAVAIIQSINRILYLFSKSQIWLSGNKRPV